MVAKYPKSVLKSKPKISYSPINIKFSPSEKIVGNKNFYSSFASNNPTLLNYELGKRSNFGGEYSIACLLNPRGGDAQEIMRDILRKFVKTEITSPFNIEDIGNNFKPKRITADKAYSSHLIHQIIESLGAMPFIAFKKNSRDTENSPDIWKKMYRYFKNNEEKFLHYYHKRSNVESVFSMVKIKFGEFLKYKNYVSQRNELMIKFIVHNICVLIDEIYKSGLNIDFKNSLKSYVDRRKKEEEFYRN